jgi:hypothetical protein
MSPSRCRSLPSTPRSPRCRAAASPSWAIRVASASREEVCPAERPDAAGPPRRHPHGLFGEATGGVLHQGDPLGAAAGPVVRRAKRPGEVVEQKREPLSSAFMRSPS